MSWQIAGKILTQRLILGTALYPSPEIMRKAIIASQAEVITVSLKRQSPEQKMGQSFWNYVKDLGCYLLPNTAGCRITEEAITIAELSREIFETNWIKLEIIGDDYTLQPNSFELVKAAEELIRRGFIVWPYCTDDLLLCQKLVEVGCEIIMPWASPIGSGQGLLNTFSLKTIRARFPHINLLIDAGIGTPSHAVQAMELGFDGILLNSAVALAHEPIIMAEAFKLAVESGRKAYIAGRMPVRDLANASTPLLDTPFWHQD